MAKLQFNPELAPIMQLLMPDGSTRSLGRVANLQLHSDVLEVPPSVLDRYRRFIVAGHRMEAELRVRLFADCVTVPPKPKRKRRPRPKTRRRKR